MNGDAAIRAQARQVAEQAARAAGALLRERAHSIGAIHHKGLVDIVTDVDVASEQLIRGLILDAFPTHSILGEEGGNVGGADPRYRWIVDPVDGTTNYAHGFPFYCVSIGLEIDSELAVGAVYDPSRDELFAAERGAGATLNDVPMHVSAPSDLLQSLLVTGFPYDRAKLPRALRAFSELSQRSQAVRRTGSAALDLCYVAAGRFDGYWEYIVRPWDMAAGVLLVREAGGQVSAVDGAAWSIDAEQVLATNGRIHPDLAAELRALDASVDAHP